MKAWLVALVALLALASCGHAKTTDADKPKAPESPPAAADAAPRRTRPASHQDSKEVPLATAPESLLKPGAEEKIRDRLTAGGFMNDPGDASMRAALRRFQKAKDLPATGVPNHETVSKLGLDPDALFRKAAP